MRVTVAVAASMRTSIRTPSFTIRIFHSARPCSSSRSTWVTTPPPVLARAARMACSRPVASAGAVGPVVSLVSVGSVVLYVAVLLYRLFSYWLPLPSGLVASILFRRRHHVGPERVTA